MTRHVVVRNIPRADAAVIAKLGAAGVATVHEAQGRTGLLGPDIRGIQSGARISGSAITVSSHPGDNLMIHAAVETVQPGDVLVVAPTSPSHHGMFGDLLATSLQVRGCAGLVIDSGVRDSADLRDMGFPVWAKAIHSEGTVKATPGSVNVPIVCAGAAVEPGDVVVADEDGVCVVRRAEAPTVAESAQSRIDRESESRERFEAGDLSLDFYGLRQTLAELGVEYVDSADDL